MMPYVALEDVGTTRRGALSSRRRLQAWERTGGTCVVCDRRIDGVRDRWIVEHIRALELGGPDELENLGPAHEACGREKTRGDHIRAADAKRQKLRHLGAAVVTRPMPGSRASAYKRKVDGTVVPRKERLRSCWAPELELQSAKAATLELQPSDVDSAANFTERLFPRAKLLDKEIGALLVDQMANRTTTETKSVSHTQEEDPSSGDVLPAIPSHLDFLFADRPLLPDEDPEQYEALLRSIVQQIRPADVIEAIWIKNITDLIWEANRIRQWRRQILIHGQLKAVEDLIRSTIQNRTHPSLGKDQPLPADYLAEGWMAGREDAKTQVDDILKRRGLTAGNVAAHGFLLDLPSIERIDRMAAMADQRRDSLLREIERKRAAFGQVVRKVATDVLDAESTDGR